MGILPNGEYTDRPEEWFPLTDFHIPGIVPGYMVSNYGRIYSSLTDTYLPKNYKETEYNSVGFRLRNGTGITIMLHRVIALIFCFNWDLDYTKDVNHLDGVKGHNWAWNLEWCTHKENLDHCIETGLMPLGEDRYNAVYTNEQIEFICQLISEGKSNTEIMNITGFPKHSIFKLIQNIKNGHCWKHISCKYDFSKAKTKNVFSDLQMHEICKYFQDYGTNNSYKKVLSHIGIDYSNMSEKELDCLNAAICNLRSKKGFKEICNQYNYEHVPKNKFQVK